MADRRYGTFGEIFVAGLPMLWPFWLVPCLALLIVRPAGRIAFYLLGLAFGLAMLALTWNEGEHSLAPILVYFGYAVSFGAALAELIVRMVLLLRTGRSATDAAPED